MPYIENNRLLIKLDSNMRALLYLSLILSLFITACGTKGPLYIPEKKYPQEQVKKPKHKPAQDTQQQPDENSSPEDNPETSK